MREILVQALDDYMSSSVFYPIRDKASAVRTLLRCIKILSVGVAIPEENAKGQIRLCVGKMSRLFCYDGEGKIFSIHFPFSVRQDEDDAYVFSARCGVILDNEVRSILMSVFKAEDKAFDALYDEDEYLDQLTDKKAADIGVTEVLKELLSYESGYIRYDCDMAAAEGRERVHPVNHLDVFYSQANTFKVGLYGEMDVNKMIDLLNVKTECHFIEESL